MALRLDPLLVTPRLARPPLLLPLGVGDPLLVRLGQPQVVGHLTVTVTVTVALLTRVLLFDDREADALL